MPSRFLDIILAIELGRLRPQACDKLNMPDTFTLITGALGEIGLALLHALGKRSPDRLIALDRRAPDPGLVPLYHEFVQGDVLDQDLLNRLGERYQIGRIYHLASILSTRAEHDPVTAHRVNVDGTLNLLQLALAQTERHAGPVVFLFPSSIAVYGLRDLEAKRSAGPADETVRCTPATIYGASKLHCEHLGRYFDRRSRGSGSRGRLDFRAVRLPGLISAHTIPTGGTSDYGPEMLHAAAAGKPYNCFVRADTRLAFMAMPDAVRALLELVEAPAVPHSIYNVTSFSPSAEEIYQLIREFFPAAVVEFEPDAARQAIVDSWPAELDDRAARRDWGWQPQYDFRSAFADYLIPVIEHRYRVGP